MVECSSAIRLALWNGDYEAAARALAVIMKVLPPTPSVSEPWKEPVLTHITAARTSCSGSVQPVRGVRGSGKGWVLLQLDRCAVGDPASSYTRSSRQAQLQPGAPGALTNASLLD